MQTLQKLSLMPKQNIKKYQFSIEELPLSDYEAVGGC